jgi:hypothetical protein
MDDRPQEPTGQPGQWWIRVPAGQFGPVDLETVRQWVQQHRITANDSIYSPEMKAWAHAPSVPQLAGLFQTQAPHPLHMPQTLQPPQAPQPPQVPQAPYLGAAPESEKKRFSLGCIVLAFIGGFVTFLIVAVIFGALLPAFVRAREAARRASCMNNIKQLGLGMKQYTQDYRDACPWREGAADPDEAWRDLGLLYPSYMSAPKTYLCPSSHDRLFEPNATGGGLLKDNWPSTLAGGNTKEVISYAYCYARTTRGPRSWHEQDRDTVRLLADKKAGITIGGDEAQWANHRDDGRNVLYNDGHTRWKSGSDPLDPDEDSDRIGKPDAIDYTDWWSDPPWYGEGSE